MTGSLVKKGAYHYLRVRLGSSERYLRLPSPKAADFAIRRREAEAAARRMKTKYVARLSTEQLRSHNVAAEAAGGQPLEAWLVQLAREARKRARRKGLEYRLSPRDLAALAARAAGQCEVTGLAFEFDRTEDSYFRPFAPSLDRIDPGKGYLAPNCRLVCVITNAALNQWGEAAFWRMIEAAEIRRCGGKVSEEVGESSQPKASQPPK